MPRFTGTLKLNKMFSAPMTLKINPKQPNFFMIRQKNIEVYIRGQPRESLLSWLESRIGPLTKIPDEVNNITFYDSSVGRVVIDENSLEDGSFTSVFIGSAESPWKTDLDLGREISEALGCVVRCDPGTHYPEVNPYSDTLLEIFEKNEKFIEVIED